MKKLFPLLLLSAFLILSWPPFSLALDSEQAGRLQIIDGTICLKISSLKCLGNNTQFPSDVGKLYCLTKIVGALNPISVTHVWYFGARERLRVSLAVKSANWRTYSSKTIRPKEIGDWSVEILGSRGETLGLYKFEIYPTPGHTGRTSLSHARRAGQKNKPAKNAVPAKTIEHPPVKIYTSPDTVTRETDKDTGDKDGKLVTRIGPPPSDGRAKSSKNTPFKIIGKKIELQIGEKGVDRLYIDLNHYSTPVVLVLGGTAPKVAIHIMNVSFWDGRPEISVNGKIIKQVRSKLHYSSGTLRILLDLDPNINYAIKSYHESKRTYCVEVSGNKPGE
ncbi:MAG: DUF2914 domain-containing protein [Desulfobacteraceae bacterium]|nr:DUF2914 domain-containing protein [Desulfobacteraceae bacterium]